MAKFEIPVKNIRQKIPNACGDACLNIVLAYHNKPHQAIGVNGRGLLDGMPMEQVRNRLNEQGIYARRMKPSEPNRITSEDLHRWLNAGPLIGATKNHYVVISGFKDGIVTIQCPLLGKRTGDLQMLNSYLNLEDRDALISTLRSPVHEKEPEAAVLPASEPNLAYRLATKVLAKCVQATSRQWTTEPHQVPLSADGTPKTPKSCWKGGGASDDARNHRREYDSREGARDRGRSAR